MTDNLWCLFVCIVVLESKEINHCVILSYHVTWLAWMK